MKTLLSLLLPLCLLGGCLAADIVPTDSGVPSDVAFYLVKDNENITELYVGSSVHMKLGVHFPQGDTDIQVELFTPDNETTLMVVCDPKVTSVGSNLAGVTTSFKATLDAKDSTTNYDRGVLDLGTITNSGSDTSSATPSLLVIEWDAIMLNSARSDVDGNVFWVSVGAQYKNETEIWVGQHSFVANLSANFTPIDSAAVNMTGPDTIGLGTSESFSLDVYLPDATSEVIVDVIIPTNGSGILSACSIALTGLGNNYKCFGKDAVNHTVTARSSGVGNDRAQLITGTMTNANARETTAFADSVVTFQFTIYLYENNTIGDVYPIGATVRIGNNAIWAGLVNVETAEKTTSSNMTATPTFSLTNQGASTLSVGQGTTLRLDINPPANSEGDYVMEILMPVNDTARMEVCLAKVTYIGLNMPCVIESEPVYSSRVDPTNSTRDKVYWNLGKIKNHGYRTDSESTLIRIEITIKLLNHSLNQDGEQLLASVGIQFSDSRIWVGQSPIAISTDETTSEQPTFTFTHAFGTGSVQVGASTYIIMEMTVPPGAVYQPMDVELLMPTYQNDTALFSLCRAELYYVGSNLPCLNQATANASITYVQGVDGKNYRAVVNLGSINNVAPNGTTVSSADVIRFGLTVLVEDHISLQNGSTDWVAAGIMYTSTRLWVGQVQVLTLRDDTITPPQNGTVYAELENSTLVANQGATIFSNMYIKIPSQSTFKVSVSVSACSDISICALYVAEAGTNLPCVTTPLSGNVTWDTTRTLGESALLNIGYVTNIHLTEAVETNATFDNNTVRVSLAGRLLTTATIGSCAITWKVAIDGSETTYPQTVDVQAAVTSNVSDTLPAFTYYMAALEENATEPTGELYPGESVLFRLDIAPNNYVSNELTVKFLAPSNSSQPMELCGVNLVHAGANIPCLQRGAITSTMSSRNNDQVNDIGTLALGSVCSYPLKSDNLSQVVTVEAVVRLRPEAAVSAGDTFWSSVTVNVDSNVIYVGQLLMTVASNFTEQFFNSSDLTVPPAVTLENVPAGPVSMSPGSYYDLSYAITFPPNMTVMAAMDISLPYNESACFTVVSFNVTGVGANLGCGAATVSTYTNVTESKTDPNTTQTDGASLDLGIVTNSGMTYRTENAVDSDNQINVTVRIQMADCVLNDHLAQLWPSFAAKVGSVIIVIDKAFTVVRSGTEAPDLLLESSLNDATQTYSNGESIEAGGCLKHSETSNAEGRDVKVTYYLPPYLTFGVLTSSNGTTPTVVALSGATGVSLTWDDLFFTDYMCFNFTLSVDMTGSAANPPSGNTPRATSPYQASATMRYRSTSSYNNDTLFYSVMSYLPVNVTGGCSKGCASTVTLVKDLNDCQLSSSSPRATISDIRIDTTSYWTPIVRCIGYPVFLQYDFGNLTRITKVSLVQDTSSGYSYINQYRLKYKNHETTWTTGELVTGVTAIHDHVLSCPVEARYVRWEMVSVMSPNQRLGVRVELYGCSASSDTSADFCSGTDPSKPTIPSLDVQSDLMVRTFLVIPTDIAFICDTNPFKTSWMYPAGGYVCYKTQGCSNNQWTLLDPQVMNILGFDSKDNALYGISRYQWNYVMSLDYAVTWYSIPASRYTLAKVESTFTTSWNVEMSPQASFSTTYQFGNGWNAKYDGLYCNTNTKILDWCFL